MIKRGSHLENSFLKPKWWFRIESIQPMAFTIPHIFNLWSVTTIKWGFSIDSVVAIWIRQSELSINHIFTIEIDSAESQYHISLSSLSLIWVVIFLAIKNIDDQMKFTFFRLRSNSGGCLLLIDIKYTLNEATLAPNWNDLDPYISEELNATMKQFSPSL